MKVNREQFLAAALLFASTTGCGRLSERMKGSFNTSQDPAVVADPVNVNQPVSDPGIAARTNGVPVKVATAPVAKNATNAKTPVKAVGPAGENVAPASENIAPAKENLAPAKENIAPASENAGPTNEGGWRRGKRGPSSESGLAPARENIAPSREGVGPSRENWRPRSGPANENVRPPPRPAPKKAKAA